MIVFKAPISPPILIIKKISKAGRPINIKKNVFICLIQIILFMYIYQIMSNSFGYLDIILLGMIAGFIILRLRSILGRKTGHESKVYPNFAEKKFSMPQKDIKPVEINLEILEGKEKKDFLKGAEIAYESILTSFANGDLIKLKSLLSPNMFSNFSDAIKSRNKENINQSLHL